MMKRYGHIAPSRFRSYKNSLPALSILLNSLNIFQGIEQLKKEEASWVRKSRWKSIQSVFGRFSIGWFSPFTKPMLKSKTDINFYSV